MEFFVIGGRTGKFRRTYWKSVLKYSLKTGTWQLMDQELKVGRYKAVSCALSNYIYVFCGWNSNQTINSVERLCLQGDEQELGWQEIPS